MLLSEAKLQSVLNFLHELDLEESGPGRPASAPQVWWVPSVGHRLWAGEWACLMCAVSSGAGAGGAARAPGAQVRGEPLRDAAAAGGGEAAGGRAAAESPGDAPTLPSDPRVPQGALSLVTGCSGLPERPHPALPAGAVAGSHRPAGQGDGGGAGPAAAGALRSHHPAAPVLHRPGDTARKTGCQGRGVRTHWAHGAGRGTGQGSRPAGASWSLLDP